MSSGLKVTELNGVKIYDCAAGKTSPEWLEAFEKKKVGSLRYNEEYRRRIELIQDFTFPAASHCIRISPNCEYIGVTGVYKPQLRMFSCSQLGMKFERTMDSQVVAFDFLTDDFSKLVILRNDRTIDFHAPYGSHFRTRIPKFGRDLAYMPSSCDLMIAASGHEVYRVNLQSATQLAPIETSRPGTNKIRINPVHQLIGLAGDDGILECWDPRDRTRAAELDVIKSLASSSTQGRLATKLANAGGLSITALEYAPDGSTFALGLSSGHVLIHDLRRPAPLLVKRNA
jgi:ribosome biogenesis protein ENP2